MSCQSQELDLMRRNDGDAGRRGRKEQRMGRI